MKDGLLGLSAKLDNLLQVSMDGPNVNWKVLALLKQEVWFKFGLNKPDGSPLFLELGFFGLHFVHGSIGIAHSKVGWNLHKIFSAVWYLMKDCPAHRREYINVTKSKVFPLKFCQIRWVLAGSRMLQ